MLSAMFLLFNTETLLAASSHAATAQVQAQLVASVAAVQPGDEFYLGVHQKIIPHWHTYWLNPGDSGVSTTINWDLPKGATVGDILWPIPSRSSLGPVTNYSYENEVTLPSKIVVPEDAKIGSDFIINATVDWLVCHEECIPQQVKLSLNLPVVAFSKPSASGMKLINTAIAQQPVASIFPVTAQADKDGITLHVASAELQAKEVKDIWFYPFEWGKIAQSADQAKQVDGKDTVIKLRHGDAKLKPSEALRGVLVVTEQSAIGSTSRGFNINVIPKPLAGVSAEGKATTTYLSFATALILALLGGAILNLMPCVFPVLSIKAISLVSHSNQTSMQKRLQGVAYTVGVLASFALLGAILIVLKAGGAQIGWGFQFQSPLFVLLVAYLMFAVGLSLSGVFSVGGSIAGVGSKLADKSGYVGSFFTGVLATIVATPCTAPFMAAALGYALTQPAFKLLAIFLTLGFGLALPYLLLTSWPALQRHLPRPGAWMERAKQVLAFPMYAATVWLVWVLAQQAGANAVAIALGGMVLIAFAAWLYDVTRRASTFNKHCSSTVVTFALLLALVGGYFGLESSVAVASIDKSDTYPTPKHWEVYTPERFEQLKAEGKPVFLNFTAAWCISCLVNERVALSNSNVVDAFKVSGITYLKGDWTNRDVNITEVLKKFGRSGVPLYVFYPAGKNAQPIELPQILTPDIVLSSIKSIT